MLQSAERGQLPVPDEPQQKQERESGGGDVRGRTRGRVSNDTCVFKDFEECKHSIPSPNIVNIDVLIVKHYQEDWDGDRDDEEEEEEEARESPSQEEDGSQVEVEEGEVSLATPGVLESSLGRIL